MHPSIHAAADPDRPAIVMARSGEGLTYGELDCLSNRNAHQFRALGLQPGDTVAICLDNCLGFLPLIWAAQRSGLVYVCISSRLTAREVAYIVEDSGAAILILGPTTEAAVGPLEAPGGVSVFAFGGPVGDAPAWEPLAAARPATPVPDETAGAEMLYSSGTTGRPKGVRLPPPASADIAEPDAVTLLGLQLFGMGPEMIYLSPAPLYHAAPLRWCISTLRLGGLAVVMERFDAEAALAAIQRYRVTHAQFVPTHFVRMLKLPEQARTSCDVSSLRLVAHAAAPCPVPVKEAMINWWGPILAEYYAGTEGNGMTFINSADWLTHRGSVGRAMLGRIRICDDQGEELPVGRTGAVYFSDGRPFAYHNDAERTAASANRHGWTTLGDVGHLDEDGFLYLTDRKSFMIISGGVNVYPQEIENLLVQHPLVADVAVFGVPDADMGERVVAVVQPADMSDAGPALAAELTTWTRERLSGVKVPRQFDFVAALPRHDTGKLYKRELQAAYR